MKIYKLESKVPDNECVYVISDSIPKAVEKFLDHVNKGLNGELYEESDVISVAEQSTDYELIVQY